MRQHTYLSLMNALALLAFITLIVSFDEFCCFFYNFYLNLQLSAYVK